MRIGRASSYLGSPSPVIATRRGRSELRRSGARLTMRRTARAVVVIITGEIRADNLAHLEAWFVDEVPPAVPLVLDLRGLAVLTLTALPVLARMTEGRGGVAVLVAADSAVARIVQQGRVDGVLGAFVVAH